ncbi:Gfo/Idh/MocA family protein [Paenibacillus xylaniclasticus]|uniref:Gfo/Idh/MocA family protein n=1 Tax=Paenibacillus xylaniclasticus TaxID=588083 RepID=UPI000FDB1282|nr:MULTISPECIES: Gfo/Idh/MocA family oxidoreductase [Paenibacillus]GFN33971.1 oxidoreductase [Paenibacillus curdlanolyticus]
MLKIAIIGTGSISSAHIEAYLQFGSRCRIVAVANRDIDKAQQQLDHFGLKAKIVSDYKELLNDDIDLVSICTPPYTHAPITIDFLEAGKHVLVEKPMASSLAECDAMNEAARKNGRILSVVAQNRFKSPMMKLKSILDNQMIGPIVHAQVDSFWWRGHSYYDLWWRGTWEKEGGGCTLNHAVHHIDALLWMMGRPSELVSVMTNTSHDNAEVEDLSIAILRYQNGALAQITSSVVHHGEEQQLIFQGAKGRVSLPWRVAASSARPNGFPVPNTELVDEINAAYDQLPDVPYEGHAGQIDNVLTAIETGEPVLIDGEDGRRALELIVGIYKAASLGQSVQFPIEADDPFYEREGILTNAIHF